MKTALQPTLLIYGASGFTGQLTVAEAVRHGLRPILAGRNKEKLTPLASQWGLEARIFDLKSPDQLTEALRDVSVVLHCAGPFSKTAAPMCEACLRTGTHYLDITGELSVFEALAEQDAAAKAAKIMVLPGVGFDVVASDCLVADLAAQHPGGRTLRIGLAARGGVSRGSTRTSLESVHNIRIRRDGVITRVPPGSMRRSFDFGVPPREAIVIPMADLATAWHTTRIPNIEAYAQESPALLTLIRMSQRSGRQGAGDFVQMLTDTLVARQPVGPNESQRREGYAVVVAEIEDASGRRATGRLRTPDPYDFTARAAVSIAERALRGEVTIGYQTPALAYGAGLVENFEGVHRETPAACD